MTLREVPRWVYAALAILWTSSVLLDAATLSLSASPQEGVPWALFFAKRGLHALFWVGVSVAALAWFHDRPITRANAARAIGLATLAALVLTALYGGFMTLALVAVTGGEASLGESAAAVWTSKLAQAFVNTWLVAALANGFHVYRRGLAKERESEQLRLRLAETELSLLRARLEPHFLFNALNTIASLVRLGRGDQATDALGKLGRLLRGMLEICESPVVAWDWERTFTEHYVALQELRFGTRLAVHVDARGVGPATQIPAFLLQPLIENAVRHGPLDDGKACRVDIRIATTGDRLTVGVENPIGGTRDAGWGVGLRNVASRLEALYPGDFSFSAGRRGDRFVVCLELPLRPGDEVEAAGAAA